MKSTNINSINQPEFLNRTRLFLTPLIYTCLVAITSACIVGCSSGSKSKAKDSKEATPTAPHVEDINIGPVQVTMTVAPGTIMLDRDCVLTIRATAPKNISIAIPSISDRLQGFIDSSQFDREPVITGTQKTIERVIKLTPLISDEYRIAPMPIRYGPNHNASLSKNNIQGTSSPKWGATPAIVLPLQKLANVDSDNTIKTTLSPFWIHPSLRTVAGYIAIIIILVILVFVIIKILGRIQRKVRLMRMSPKERALEELKDLLRKKLIEKHLIKDFYVELTMVVRRYIERQHHVRAPEQTTEEFLTAITANSEFSPEVIKRLREFLKEADLVKFATYTPNQSSNNAAIETAKSYITTDDNEFTENSSINSQLNSSSTSINTKGR